MSGALPRGTRLPPTRDLAAQLEVARNCVVDAYDELIADGLLEGRGRHGTFVTSGAFAVPAQKHRQTGMPAVLQRLPGDRDHVPVQDGVELDWRPGQANARTLPLEVWRNACREAGRHLPPQGYGDPRGEPSLRHAIVAWLREHRSVRVDPDQIVVTHGTGHALHLVAQALLNKGDLCATEDPGYAGAALAFNRANASLRYVPVDDEGICVKRIVNPDHSPLLLHVTPTHQYPMGGRLSGPRRRTLIELARTHGILILENEYDCEFHYAGTNHPPIFASAPESTLLLSTFGKAVSPSLRLGFIAAPTAAARALAGLVEGERGHVSWPVQKIVEMLLVSGELDRHLRRLRRHYGAMRDAIRQRLRRYSDVVILRGDEGGLHVVIAGKSRPFDRALRQALRSRGILLDDVGDFATLKRDACGFLFGYGHMDQETLQRSLDELEGCIQWVGRNLPRHQGNS
ncbi:PLP-dependent aminotransferase family protein [Paraburkholderia sp. J12]|uniref:MocR-like pyridoxine biosynthesis transcription factor PdxR n=1 Tax=Paraburkholderia sp. J12 TaxID=2805432 RepID=UPI002ABDA6B7|nr:PLP-dependent aminotransferase family protein [Paraburkholderia sp. J12]